MHDGPPRGVILRNPSVSLFGAGVAHVNQYFYSLSAWTISAKRTDSILFKHLNGWPCFFSCEAVSLKRVWWVTMYSAMLYFVFENQNSRQTMLILSQICHKHNSWKWIHDCNLYTSNVMCNSSQENYTRSEVSEIYTAKTNFPESLSSQYYCN